jgi:ribonuclease R
MEGSRNSNSANLNNFQAFNPPKTYIGTVMGHKRGFGFLEHEGGAPVYLPHGVMKRVFHGDTIEIETATKGDGRTHVDLIAVHKVELSQMVGKMIIENDQCFILPDHHRFYHKYYIPKHMTKSARHDDYVAFKRIEKRGENRAKIKVVHVIGKKNAPGFEHQYALTSTSMVDFYQNNNVIENKLIDQLPEGYLDYRDKGFFTVDGEFSTDLDDALFVESTKVGWDLYVAIADVSHYVKEMSNIDFKAKKQGQKIFMPGLSVSMLPDDLIRESLSLLPNKERLVMIAKVSFNSKGKILGFNHEFAVICSKAKLSYKEVTNYVEGWDAGTLKENHPSVANGVKNLFELTNLINLEGDVNLRKVDKFNIMVDYSSKKAFEIKRQVSMLGHKMIEKAMVVCNMCTAELIVKSGLSAPFRAHGGLNESRREEAEMFLKMLLQKDVSVLDDYSEFKKIRNYLADQKIGEHYESVLMSFINKSNYINKPSQHYGLGLDYYLTATSPIRKYSDLVTQRIVKSIVLGKASVVNIDNEFIDSLNNSIGRVTNTSLLAERLFMLQYVEDIALSDEHKNDIYKAKIIDIDRNGFMVKTVDHGITGYIHKSNLASKGDAFVYDQTLEWADDMGERYFIGKVMDVKIAKSDRQSQSIDLSLVIENGAPKKAA